MTKASKDKNYFKTQNILEIIKWSFNNKDVNFLYASVYDTSELQKPFVEPDFLSINNKENVFVATTLTAFVNEIISELTWQATAFEEGEITQLTLDIGVAHTQDIKMVANDEYNKTSKAITFNSVDEIYSFAETLFNETEMFYNSHTIEVAYEDLTESYNRLKTLLDVEDFDLILSEDDIDTIDIMDFKKPKVHVSRVKKGNEEVIVITDNDLIM